MVHDFVRDNAAQIDRFINEARAAGHQFVPELAPDCLPIVNGEIMYDIDAYIGR